MQRRQTLVFGAAGIIVLCVVTLLILALRGEPLRQTPAEHGGYGTPVFEQMPDRAPYAEESVDSSLIGYAFERRKPYRLVGYSLEGREIQSYQYGTGGRKVIFVGGIHGGYEWNTVLLAYQIIDYFIDNAHTIPKNVQVLVIPALNPDGLFRVVGTSERFGLSDAPQFVTAADVLPTDVVVSGRFNARGVDLNRNFACEWKPKAVWRSYSVSAGMGAFSEPETQSLKSFMESERPVAVIMLHSGSNGIYSAGCNGEVLDDTTRMLAAYAQASGYQAYDEYSHYDISGDAADWLSAGGITSFTVELRTHNEIEWDRNLPGIRAALEYASKR